MTLVCYLILLIAGIYPIHVYGFYGDFVFNEFSSDSEIQRSQSPYDNTGNEIGSRGFQWNAILNYILGNGATVGKTNQAPPPPQNLAATARYVVRAVNWASIATISTMKGLKGAPFSNIVSINDGFPNFSTGIPYMYLMESSASVRDLAADNRASLSMTMAETDYCRRKHEDPQLPLCPRVTLNGDVRFVDNSTEEYKLARQALFSRHPSMKQWPQTHHFHVAKLHITAVLVLDYFGGIKSVDPIDYFRVKMN